MGAGKGTRECFARRWDAGYVEMSLRGLGAVYMGHGWSMDRVDGWKASRSELYI